MKTNGKVAKLPGADYGSQEALSNRIAHSGPAIIDAARFVTDGAGDFEAAMSEVAKRWPGLGLPEIAILNLIVTAVLEDRITQLEAND
ncbi:hypothetical protein [Phyllobacterium leguminum]|uniref:Uncharacterized protein n=1 Tax=Phyllobacterium leguminum TaxID=314237 RepID=A0A318TDX5_9HYPH|nr:hypothetical protein [Phyllobacterium leguminum]PYE89576.1 hypothetical protein C7477_10384 [Phyllobacterium leguminum]